MLRSIVVTAHSEPDECDLAGKLFGVLGKGAWEEYDSDTDWRRFDTAFCRYEKVRMFCYDKP